MLEPQSDNLKKCAICKVDQGKYVCPRCNISYCSVPCYKATEHLNCSESFYKECIQEELKAQNRNPESQKEMYKILERIENEVSDESLDSDDDEPELELSERLANTDLDDADAVWEKLTEEEKIEFVDLLQKGDVSQIVPPWEPWWKYREEKKLIEELNDSAVTKENFMEICPKHLEEIPSFEQICKRPPSTCVQYNLVNVLCAYVYVTQFFAGDHHNFSMEAVNVLLIICNNIRIGRNYDSAEIALQSAVSEASNCQWLSGSIEFQKSVKNDVKCIIEGPNDNNRSFYILSALSDLHRVIGKAKSEKGKGTQEQSAFAKKFCDRSLFSLPPVSNSKLHTYLKKIEYYISWGKMYAADVFSV